MIADMLHALTVATVASSLAIFIVLIVRNPMRQAFGAGAAYALWVAVPFAAAVVLVPAPVADVALASVTAAPTQVLSLPLSSELAAPAWRFDPVPLLLALWLAGALALSARLAVQQRHFVRALGTLSRFGRHALQAQSAQAGPALVGALRPRIVVPADFAQRFNPSERRLILAHERLHQARGDAQVNLLAALLRCLFWFNPLVHFAASRFRFDQELACDALVIARFPEARRPYADAMLKTQLAGESRQELGLPVGCYWQPSHPLKERISMLKQPLPGRMRRVFGFGIAALLCAVGTYAAWAAQPASQGATSTITGAPLHAIVEFSLDGAPLTGASSETDSHSMVHDGATNIWRLGFRAGEPFRIALHQGGESWTLKGTASPRSDDTFDLDCQFEHDGAVVGRPRLLLRDGVPAGVKLGTETSAGFKGFGAQITLARGTDPAVGNNPDANGQARALSIDPNLHATYRSMRRIAYPAAQLAAKVEGVVYVRVHVSAEGDPTDVAAVTFDPPGASALAYAAVDGVKQWRFNAPMKDGRPSASDEIIPIVFSLRPDGHVTTSGGTLDAIRISPPDEPRAASADRPPTEDVSFRVMHPPKYPAEAVRNKQSASLQFKVLVDEHGTPQSVDVASSDPPDADRMFAQASIDAIMQWRFNPGVKDGEPSAGYVFVPITFSLDDE